MDEILLAVEVAVDRRLNPDVLPDDRLSGESRLSSAVDKVGVPAVATLGETSLVIWADVVVMPVVARLIATAATTEARMELLRRFLARADDAEPIMLPPRLDR